MKMKTWLGGCIGIFVSTNLRSRWSSTTNDFLEGYLKVTSLNSVSPVTLFESVRPEPAVLSIRGFLSRRVKILVAARIA